MEKQKIKSFKDLNVWQEGHKLVVMIYTLSKGFPKEEIFGLTSQIRRAAVSITSNIAEGFGRESYKEKAQFYSLAHGSLSELESQLLISLDIGYLSKLEYDKLFDQLSSVHRLLNAFIRTTKDINLNSKFQIPNSASEAGVTLLLAVFVLSAISLISLTVGFFALQEIRSSRSIVLTEPALSAAQTGGEQGIWSIKRSGSLASCPGAGSTSLGNSTRVDLCKSFSSATINLTPGVPFNIFLYDPNDINGNLCMNASYTQGQHSGCSGAALYTSISVIHKSGTSNVAVSAFDVEGNSFAGSSIVVTPGNNGGITIPDPIPSSGDERIEIILSSSTATTVEINALPLGLPDYPTVNASGCASKVVITSCNGLEEIFKRRINITVPQ